VAPQGVGRLCKKDSVPSESVRAVVDFLTALVVPMMDSVRQILGASALSRSFRSPRLVHSFVRLVPPVSLDVSFRSFDAEPARRTFARLAARGKSTQRRAYPRRDQRRWQVSSTHRARV
jgi:hypothetical protein